MSLTYKLIIAALIVLALAGLYKAGESIGYSQGRLVGDGEGYKRAWDSQQIAVDGITKKYNDLQNTTTDKIENLQQDAAKNADTIQKLLKAKDTQASEIVTKYLKAYPTTTTTCGLSLPSVNAIREIMELQ